MICMAEKAVLTDRYCNAAEKAAEKISSYPTKLKICNETFNYVANFPTVQEWLSDTDIGVDLKQRIIKNIASLENMATGLTTLVTYTNQLVAESRKANQKK